MPNEKNLIRMSDLSPEERRARASKAGKASAKARRKRKAMKSALDELMTLPPNSPEAQAALKGIGALLDDADNQTAVLAGLMKAAMAGDFRAVKELRNILGESRDTSAEKAERKARTEQLKAKTAALKARSSTEPDTVENDGFLDAISRKAAEDW